MARGGGGRTTDGIRLGDGTGGIESGGGGGSSSRTTDDIRLGDGTGGMESGGGGGSSSRTTDDISLGDETGGMEIGGGGGSSTRKTYRRNAAWPPLPVVPRQSGNLDGGGVDDCVEDIRLLDDSKHRDGSIYRDTNVWYKIYRINDTEETYLEPMMMSMPNDCWPNKRACQQHFYCHMMQVYSVKLAYTSVDGPVQLYGYMAARDLLNPLRNYMFNRTRDDPFVVDQDGDQFIQMSGPKRGIDMHSSVLLEFDMRIKVGENEEDDLQLIDGAVCFSDLGSPPGIVYTRRIDGDCGAVDISLALLYDAAEATIQVGISGLCGSGLSLFLAACGNRIKKEIRLFDGVIVEPCDLNRFVVAAVRGPKFIVRLKFGQNGGSARQNQFVLFDVRHHGDDTMIFHLDYATIQVKVTWSTVDIPTSALREDNYYEFAEYESVDYDYQWKSQKGCNGVS